MLIKKLIKNSNLNQVEFFCQPSLNLSESLNEAVMWIQNVKWSINCFIRRVKYLNSVEMVEIFKEDLKFKDKN
ncbi:hypothetical protein BpHYR1_019395 [Brachionus plicatilis]|uniref:Uncharacterized protein n=1 Tax=Brachionus plicatilis TaxID=10195 RepID=A0A3M7PG85_BRAPC|nr:hypothetical protein BpHYR1_019395 [Brachionus plicatilis]